MAIDSTLWMVDIPAGTYSVGDVVSLSVKSGPMNVRSGRGAAVLKKIYTGSMAAGAPYWRIHVKNSNWIDEVVNFAGSVNSATSFADDSGNVQRGADVDLMINSGWEVYAECVYAGTSTSNNTLFAQIDVDYPLVSAVADPTEIVGDPTSIIEDMSTNVNAIGASAGAQWTVTSVDYFKAGFIYCLESVEAFANGNYMIFLAMSNAAGMGGLTRIIPMNNNVTSIRTKISYSSRLVKGPMDVKIMAFASDSASSADFKIIHDYVKRRGA